MAIGELTPSNMEFLIIVTLFHGDQRHRGQPSRAACRPSKPTEQCQQQSGSLIIFSGNPLPINKCARWGPRAKVAARMSPANWLAIACDNSFARRFDAQQVLQWVAFGFAPWLMA